MPEGQSKLMIKTSVCFLTCALLMQAPSFPANIALSWRHSAYWQCHIKGRGRGEERTEEERRQSQGEESVWTSVYLLTWAPASSRFSSKNITQIFQQTHKMYVHNTIYKRRGQERRDKRRGEQIQGEESEQSSPPLVWTVLCLPLLPNLDFTSQPSWDPFSWSRASYFI